MLLGIRKIVNKIIQNSFDLLVFKNTMKPFSYVPHFSSVEKCLILPFLAKAIVNNCLCIKESRISDLRLNCAIRTNDNLLQSN